MRPYVLLLLVATACGSQGGPGSPGAPDAAAAIADAGGDPAACSSWQRPTPVPAPVRDDGLAPLASAAVPAPTGGDIVDLSAAVRLGKVFFWDTQAGGDGQTACASCHVTAGADSRRMNTVAPGPDAEFDYEGVTGPAQLAEPHNIGADDRIGSQGVSAGVFHGVASDPAESADLCDPVADPIFAAHRVVTGRNAPTVIAAVFSRTLFWDGRAEPVFNGADPFGDTGNAGDDAPLTIAGAALASQAVGPANNQVEMSCAGRGFRDLADKLLARPPLARQTVAPDDSALGCLSAWPAPGLACGGAPCTYRALIAEAFGPDLAADADNQFARIWGQAIQAYESTLVPDDTPFDRFLAGDGAALTQQQQDGLAVFVSSRCNHCHAGAELSDASVGFAAVNGLVNVDGGDQGFHHNGVRPTSINFSEDLGRAGEGPRGVSFSHSGGSPDRGAFKTPSLRNVGLTAPYFHNGGKAALVDVLDFYAAGGDFSSTASQFRASLFLPTEEAALLDFLGAALTDCRVATEKAPFDHPSIEIPNGPELPAVGADGTGTCPSR
ncbi:MAG TPA: cytochrome c peroxidase [Kofleriaceae bacterium]